MQDKNVTLFIDLVDKEAAKTDRNGARLPEPQVNLHFPGRFWVW